MVHVYCNEFHINEINVKTQYHNKQFKKICDKIGVKCTKTSCGYTDVELTTNLIVEFNKFINDKQLVQLLSIYN